MGKRVLVIVLLVALALFAYMGYSSYDARRAGVTGQVFSSDSSRGRQKAKPTSPTSSAEPTTTDSSTPPTDSETIVYPSAQDAPASVATPAANGGPVQVTQSQQAAPTAPASDTISPNPPNGMVFSGSGRYQLYRQGNITWRLDTETGRSCIIFATDDEWKKPRVYKAGCGRS
jgi:hypothetical protein